jgi:DNA repair exonuclease SbcCD nuclease subunit
MKIGILSDLHLNLWSYGATINCYGFNSRLWDQWTVLREFVEYCNESGIEDVVCTGDVFHKHNIVPTQALYVANEFFSELSVSHINTTIIAGNHDFDSKSSSITSLSWLSNIDRCKVITSFGRWSRPELGNCLGIGYTNSGEHLRSCLTQAEGCLVFMHQGVFGQDVGNGFVLKDEVLTQDMIPTNARHCFTGHYHNHTKVSDRLTIVGAPVQHNWGDMGTSRGWVVYDTLTGRVEHIQSRHPMFTHINYKGASVPTISKEMRDAYKGHFIQAVNYAGDIGKLRSYYKTEVGARTLEVDTVKEENTHLDVPLKDRLTVMTALNGAKSGLDKRRQEVAVEIVEDTYEVTKPAHT